MRVLDQELCFMGLYKLCDGQIEKYLQRAPKVSKLIVFWAVLGGFERLSYLFEGLRYP